MIENTTPGPHSLDDIAKLLDDELHVQQLSMFSPRIANAIFGIRLMAFVALLLAPSCVAITFVGPPPAAMLVCLLTSMALILVGALLQCWADAIERNALKVVSNEVRAALQDTRSVPPHRAKIIGTRHTAYTMLLLGLHCLLMAFAPWPGRRLEVLFCLLAAGYMLGAGAWQYLARNQEQRHQAMLRASNHRRDAAEHRHLQRLK